MSIISGMRTASADLNQIGACGAFLSEVADLARQAELDKCGLHKRLGKEQTSLDHARLKRATGLMEKLSSSPQRQFERLCCPQLTTRIFRVPVGNDRAQLSKMALAARAAMGKPKLKVLADRGYFSGPEILAARRT